MLYLLIEDFRGGDAGPVFGRLRDRGRQLPPGLAYVGSWVTSDLRRCYQVMECDDRDLLDQWIALWEDLVDFEVVLVISSADAAAAVG